MTQNQNYPPGLSRWREDWADQGALCVDWVEFEKENPGWAANCATHGCYVVVPPPRVDACAIWLDYGYSGQSIYFYCNELRPGGPIPIYDATAGRWYCQAENRFKNPGPTCAVGNPVNPGFPNKFQVETDLVLPGAHPLRIERTYNSSGKEQGAAVGTRWRGQYFQALAPKIGLQMATVFAHRPDGRTLFFTLMKNGAAVPLTPFDAGAAWQTDADTDDRLTRVVDAGGATLGWQYYVAKSEETEHYDAAGRLSAVVHRAGSTHALAYDGNGRLASVTDAFGRQLAMAYDAGGRLATITDPANHVYQYAHDATGNLTAVTFPGGGTRTYLYNESALTGGANLPDVLTGIVDENGARFANFGYDSSRRPVLTEHAGGADRYTLTYSGASATITDSRGTIRTHAFTNVLGVAKPASITQPCETCGGGKTSATAYDANGNATSRTDFNGKKVCYAYDLSRNLETARVEGILSSESCSTVLATPPNRPDVRRVTTSWHPTYRLPATLTEPAPGGTRTTTFTYDASGNLTQKTLVAPKNDGSGATMTRTWSWTYGTLGRVLTATDPDGRVTTYAYHADNDADPGRRGQLQAITSPAGHVTQVTAYDASGRPRSTVDPNGLVTTLTFDARGRLTERNVGGEATSYVYDAAGQLTGVVLPDNSTLTYTYDAAHRLTRIADGLGNRIDYTLDAAGNRTQERVYDPGGTLAR
ncbi:MAG: RHS repeat protein, partial [Betaproteobacteria bacterium]|nr:RHS repeat protein [Betaproteobacteria bacterium]